MEECSNAEHKSLHYRKITPMKSTQYHSEYGFKTYNKTKDSLG